MKVLGELQNAQLEQLDVLPTPGTRGRVFTDTRQPTNPVPTFDTGSVHRPFLLGQSDGLVDVSVSAGVATVDWSQGLNQKLTLYSSCVIKFINPQEGQIHSLLVYQITGNIFSYTFDMPDQDSGNLPFQPGILFENEVARYAWFYKNNGKSAEVSVPGPAFYPRTAASTTWYGIDISPDGKWVTGGQSGTPYTRAYSLKKSSLLQDSPYYTGTAPTAAVDTITAVKYNPNGKALFVVGNTSPYVEASPAQDGIFNGAMPNPGTLPTGAGRDVDVHPSGLFVAVGHATTPFMSVYPFKVQGWGTKLTNPGTLPAAQVNGVRFSPDGNYLTTACQTSPFIRTYAFNASSGAIGAVVADPSVLPAGGPSYLGIAWRPQGDYIAMGMSVTPYIYVIPFNAATGAYGTPLTVPAPSIPAGAVQGVSWSKCGSYLLVCANTSPGLYIYDFSNKDLSTLVVFSSGSTNENTLSACVDLTNNYCLVGTATTSQSRGFPLPNVQKNYFRIY